LACVVSRDPELCASSGNAGGGVGAGGLGVRAEAREARAVRGGRAGRARRPADRPDEGRCWRRRWCHEKSAVPQAFSKRRRASTIARRWRVVGGRQAAVGISAIMYAPRSVVLKPVLDDLRFHVPDLSLEAITQARR